MTVIDVRAVRLAIDPFWVGVAGLLLCAYAIWRVGRSAWRRVRWYRARKGIAAIHAEMRTVRARRAIAEDPHGPLIGDRLVDRVHHAWDPRDANGPTPRGRA